MYAQSFPVNTRKLSNRPEELKAATQVSMLHTYSRELVLLADIITPNEASTQQRSTDIQKLNSSCNLKSYIYRMTLIKFNFLFAAYIVTS